MELIFAPISQEDPSRLDTRRCRRLEGSEDGVLGRDWQGAAGGWEAKGVGGSPSSPVAAAYPEGRLSPGPGKASESWRM